MNIRQAILAAADHIEINPRLFDFEKVRVPACGTPGCVLGWVCHFMSVAAGESISRAEELLKLDNFVFYQRMWELDNEGKPLYESVFSRSWRKDASRCASTLRKYADRYHPAEPVSWACDLTSRLAAMAAIAEDA